MICTIGTRSQINKATLLAGSIVRRMPNRVPQRHCTDHIQIDMSCQGPLGSIFGQIHAAEMSRRKVLRCGEGGYGVGIDSWSIPHGGNDGKVIICRRKKTEKSGKELERELKSSRYVEEKKRRGEENNLSWWLVGGVDA